MERLIIAEVLKPQGIRGELKIKTFTDYPEDVKDFKTLYIDNTPYKILSYRVAGENFAFVGLRGVTDRNTAELLRGKTIEGDRADAPALEEGRYYIVDLLGSKVITEQGEELGTLVDITQLSSEIYTVEKDGKRTMFPAVRNVIVKVDVENKTITVDKKIYEETSVS